MINLAKQSSTFCIMPFTHIATKTNGEFKLCCRSLPIDSIKEKSLLEVWNGNKYKKIRKQMLLGERPKECNPCWFLEDRNIKSMRQRENLVKCQRGDYYKVLNDLNNDYSLPDKILSIDLKLNNLCNLKCRMCHPMDSIQWSKDWPLISELQKHNEWTYKNVNEHNLVEHPYMCEWENHPSFFEDLNKLTDSLDTIWFAGGEPLIDPMHYKILDHIKEKGKNIKLQYASNFTTINFRGKSILDYWKYFKHVLVGVSIDGIGDTFNYIRTNGNFDAVIKNIKMVREEALKSSLDILLISACTFQAYNIFDLPEIFNFFIENDIFIHTHRVTYPRFLSCQVLPKELKIEVSNKINEYMIELKTKNLDLAHYKNANQNILDNLNFMNKDDLSYMWPQFLEYSKIIDKAVGSKPLEEIRPEIKKFTRGNL